jgi:hypothetical protein
VSGACLERAGNGPLLALPWLGLFGIFPGWLENPGLEVIPLPPLYIESTKGNVGFLAVFAGSDAFFGLFLTGLGLLRFVHNSFEGGKSCVALALSRQVNEKRPYLEVSCRILRAQLCLSGFLRISISYEW